MMCVFFFVPLLGCALPILVGVLFRSVLGCYFVGFFLMGALGL